MSEDEPIQLGPLRFDPRTGELASDRGSEILPVKVAALLMTLHNANGAMLSREQLLDQCWGQGNGSDEGLTQAVAYLRRALGRLGSDSDMLKTYPKRGYALKRTVPIDENESNNRGRGPGSRAWIIGVMILAVLLIVLASNSHPVRHFIRHGLGLGAQPHA